jgi:HD-GYP domain-containing protein (c-di-GMP phosphodiesterase class II)
LRRDGNCAAAREFAEVAFPSVLQESAFMPSLPEPRHFAHAVTELGVIRPVVASTAIFNSDGVKLIEKGVSINARIYERLTQHRLATPLEQCVESEPGVTRSSLREAMESMCADEPFFAAMLEDPPLRGAFLDEIELMPLPKVIGFQLTLMRETRPEQWMHALRSAITAAWLGSREHAIRFDLRQLAAAGLVHDLGMLHLDPLLLQPELDLSRDQRRQLYSHPLVSVLLLERYPEYSAELVRAVREHHEAMDGSGYPGNVHGDRISPWGRVLALTEVVTSMFGSNRPARGQRLSLVLRMNRHRFDARLVHEITRLLPHLHSSNSPAIAQAPTEALAAIDALLARWVTSAPDTASLPKSRAAAVDRVRDLCGQAQRVLSETGAAPVQLAQLDGLSQPAELRVELGLIAQEAAWQLRSVARQTRRRWRLGPGETYPAGVQEWLDDADALCARLLQG